MKQKLYRIAYKVRFINTPREHFIYGEEYAYREYERCLKNPNLYDVEFGIIDRKEQKDEYRT